MKLLVDGVFFQLTNTGIARVWSSILPRLARVPGLEIVMLDRGNCPAFEGVERVEFPAYKLTANTVADSFLIDAYCRTLNADVFSSTYYTTPINTPSMLIVYDMIPEVLKFNLAGRMWQEKHLAISYASYSACISENTKRDLNRLYPATEDRSFVTHCGVDRDVFRPRDAAQVAAFKSAFSIRRPYFLFVGSREQGHGYKNGAHVFNAARGLCDFEFEFLCIGGEKTLEPDLLATLPDNISVKRCDLTDIELACAYSGAEALVFPSLYEGFGMPVAEAMACGCPVITTPYGSLPEVAGDAAIFISARDEAETRDAMIKVRDANVRAKLMERGLQQASRFSWDKMANSLYELLKRAYSEKDSPVMTEFFRRWAYLRRIQMEVDTST